MCKNQPEHEKKKQQLTKSGDTRKIAPINDEICELQKIFSVKPSQGKNLSYITVN